ncbi:MAG: glycosyltransferase family 4 protein [Pirellulaceae bacterium]|nr:glycosyltransferase family 4 protein [Pirellulaceae bacterium]
MRVAYVCADLGVPVFGSKGCSIHVQEIVRSFLKRGDQVELFVARTGGAVPAEFSDCIVHVFPPESAKDTAHREVVAQHVAEQISDALESRGPFDLVYERHSLWSAAGPKYSQAYGIPSILEINAPLIYEQRMHRGLVDADLAFATSQLAFAQANSLAVVSEEVANAIMTDFDIDRSKLHVVPNGVDTRRFSPDVPASLPSDEFTIGFVGSLKPWHGVETLLEAFAKLLNDGQHARLLIVGDGPMRSQLEKNSCQPGSVMSEKVHWIGSVSPSEVPGYLTSMDVAVAPYPDLENFYFSPLKVYEYMACGVSTVASEIGQLKSIINHRSDGFLYPPCSIAALASTLSALVNQPTLRADVGRRARARAVREFSWDQVLMSSLATVDQPGFESKAATDLESSGGRCK